MSHTAPRDFFIIFFFCVTFILFHIFHVLHNSRGLQVAPRQGAVKDVVVMRRSATRERLQQQEEEMEETGQAGRTEERRYQPVLEWPDQLDPGQRWQFFLNQCARRANVSLTRAADCALESEMARRAVVVRRACRDNKALYDPTATVDGYKMFALTWRRLAWCPVYKAASTNWMKNMPRLSRYSAAQVSRIARQKETRQANTLARAVVPYLPAPRLTAFLQSHPKPTLFLIVRHPFDRLLSAYRDKLEVYNKWYYSKYGKRMVGEWRAAGRVRAGDAFYSRDAGNGAPVRVAEPTWWEFVSAVLAHDIWDEHWRPVLDLCSPCAQGVEYDFVLKFEQLAEEERWLVERLGLTGLVPSRHENRNRAGNMTAELRDRYFSLLSEEQVWQLYKKYRMDFTMFEYEIDPKYLIRYYDKTNTK